MVAYMFPENLAFYLLRGLLLKMEVGLRDG